MLSPHREVGHWRSRFRSHGAEGRRECWLTTYRPTSCLVSRRQVVIPAVRKGRRRRLRRATVPGCRPPRVLMSEPEEPAAARQPARDPSDDHEEPGESVWTEYRGQPLQLQADRTYQFSLELFLGKEMDPILREELMVDGSNLRQI